MCVRVCACVRQDKILNLLVVLDAHSQKVARKHYLLRGPEDDILLADKLIEAARCACEIQSVWWLERAPRFVCF